MKYTVGIPEKILICLNRGCEESEGDDDIFIICTRKYEMVRMTYFDTLLCYVLSLTFCGADVLKVMDQ